MKNTLEETNRRINEVKEWISELVNKMVLLERLLKIPWTAIRLNHPTVKEISPEYSSEGLTDVEAEAPILWPRDVKNWLSGKDPDAWEDGGQEEKGTAEDEMFGWHHRLNGHEFEQTLGDGERQGNLAYCDPSSSEDSDMTWAFEQQQALKVITGLYVRNI